MNMIEPKLRFKADDGSKFPDWEEKVFGDFVDTHLEKTSNKDKYPLYSLTIESGVQPKTDRYEREFLVKKEGDNYKIVPPNAFVYNPMNLRFGALKVNHEKFSVSVSGYYDVFSLKDDSVLAFWENYLVTPKMLNYYFSIATGSLIEKLRVHYSQFVKIKKPLPSIPEQQKIAEFLSTIDTVIEKQKETVSAWEERKKGVMQKLFSQKVRFKADDGSEFPEWEEKKLGDIADVIMGQSPDGDSVNLNDGLYLIQGKADLLGSNIVPERFTNKPTKICEPLDLVMTVRAPVGYVVRIEFKACIGRGVCAIRAKKIDSNYLLHYMAFKENEWKKIEQGSTFTAVNSDDVKMFKVSVPCLAEQQKIADCLSSLNEVIEKQKATLAAWEELKKGLLQQMFV
jgi:possible type I site-specific deoxyribonuclease specificity subunit